MNDQSTIEDRFTHALRLILDNEEPTQQMLYQLARAHQVPELGSYVHLTEPVTCVHGTSTIYTLADDLTLLAPDDWVALSWHPFELHPDVVVPRRLIKPDYDSVAEALRETIEEMVHLELDELQPASLRYSGTVQQIIETAVTRFLAYIDWDGWAHSLVNDLVNDPDLSP